MTGDPDIQQAIIEQGQIGWIEMLLGKTSKKWMDIQEAYLQEIESSSSAERWSALLVFELWQVTWKLWLHRNEVLHEGNKSHLIDQADLDNKLREQWHLGPEDLHPTDQSLFHNLTIEDLLVKNRHFQQSWLSQVLLARDVAELADGTTSSSTEPPVSLSDESSQQPA